VSARTTTPGAVPVGRMAPFTVLSREQRVRRSTEPEPVRHAPPGPQDWEQRADCRDEDPELFQPIGTTGPALLQIEDAKAVCYRCPALQPCAAWSLGPTGPDSGVLGAMSAEERRHAKRRLAKARLRSRSGS
jgi:WhiB family transcriptional regulator, redox-sensing transcriptional regulator